MYKKLWNKDYLLLCQGTIFSTFGAVLYSAAIGYWVYEVSGSTSMMGVLSAISYAIQVVMGPISGSLTDYLKRRNILVITDFIRGIIFLFLGMMAINKTMNMTEVVIAAIISGFCSSLFTPASSSLTPDILSEEVIIKGQSIMGGATNIINLVGTAISGMLIVKVGVPWLILINGICYVVSAISEMFIYNYSSHNNTEKINFSLMTNSLKECFKYVMNSSMFRKMIIMILGGNFLTSGFFNLLLPYALNNNMSTEQYGYLGAFISAGSLIGTLSLAVVNIYDRKPMKIAAVAFLLAEVFSAIGLFVGKFYFTSVMLLLSFLCNGIGNGVLNAMMVIVLPEERRGVLLGSILTVVYLGNSLSAVVYGYLGDYINLNLLGSISSLIAILPVSLLFSKDVQALNDNGEI